MIFQLKQSGPSGMVICDFYLLVTLLQSYGGDFCDVGVSAASLRLSLWFAVQKYPGTLDAWPESVRFAGSF